MVKYIKYHS